MNQEHIKISPQHIDSMHNFCEGVQLKHIMTEKVITINVDDRFSLVEEKMREFRIRHLPVIDKNKKLVGIVTQRDLYKVQSPRRDENGNWFYDKESLDEHILKYVMTPEPFTLKPEDHLGDAILHMVDRKYGSIPIVNEKHHVIGIITQIDILRIAAEIVRRKHN